LVGWGFAPDPTGGANSAPTETLAVFMGLTSLKRGGERRDGKGREGEGKKRNGRGGGRGEERGGRVFFFALGKKVGAYGPILCRVGRKTLTHSKDQSI